MPDSEKLEVLKRLATAIKVIAESGGIDVGEVINALAQAETEGLPSRTKSSGPDKGDALGVKEARFLAQVLSLWRKKASYTDQMGHPKALQKIGRGSSIEALFNEVRDKDPGLKSGLEIEVAIEKLLSNGAISLRPDGNYEQVRKSFWTTKSGINTGIAALEYVAEFAETIACNFEETIGENSRRFHRVARSSRFPKGKVRLVQGIIEDQGMSFLSYIDELMDSERESENLEDADSIEIGVGIYRIERPAR